MIAMADKLTYEELQKRVVELEAQNLRLAEAQDELKRSLNFTESLLASIPTPVFYKDIDGRYLGCNTAFTEIMGITSEQIRGKTVHELWPSDHASVYHEKDLELMKNPQLQIYEFEVKDKEGYIRPVVYHKTVFRDERGTVAGLVGAFVDISEMKEMESKLKTSEENFRAIFDLSADMQLVIKDDEIIKANKKVIKLLGY